MALCKDRNPRYTKHAQQFSAHSSMWRITTLFLVLMALIVPPASGSSKRTAKARGNVHATTTSHSAKGKATSRKAAPVKSSKSAKITKSSRSAKSSRATQLSNKKSSRVTASSRAVVSKTNKKSRVASREEKTAATATCKVTRTRHGRVRSCAQQATLRQASFTRTRILMPTPLRGSLESLTRQNERTEAEGLERIEDDADLNDRIAHKLLVPLPTSSALGVNANLPENRRYCRSWTAQFLIDLSKAHNLQFGTPIQVTSAVRTVEYQKQLMGVNGNATQAEGDIVSPHLTGATIDIGKSNMTLQEIAWMRTHLLDLQNANKIDVEEEFKQACFHITVYKEYAPEIPIITHRPSSKPVVQAINNTGA